ncbi:MAG: HAD-IIB family hydrolase [Candidatus Aminicenantes bacterium]|nr:HAD-IIB family hydrolase [Candidatus Aminicenantes bacterium]
MKKTNILPKLVASDIGGTLIRGGGAIPPFTAKVLDRLVADGIPVALITGYNYHTAVRITANLDDRVLLLPQNGSLCIKEKKLVWEYRIPGTAATELFDFLDKQDFPIIIYKGKNEDFGNFYFYREELPLSYAFRRLEQLPDVENITGISTLLPDEAAQKVRSAIQDIVGDKFKVIYTREVKGSWLEVTHAEVRKDLTLERLCKELGISPAEAVYFGDNFNDLEALWIVGSPVLVDNAAAELKEEFDMVIAPVTEEGVAHYLNELFNLQCSMKNS